MLDETQLAGTGDRLCASFDLEFLEDVPVGSLDGIQSHKQAFADLAIRETLGNQTQDL